MKRAIILTATIVAASSGFGGAEDLGIVVDGIAIRAAGAQKALTPAAGTSALRSAVPIPYTSTTRVRPLDGSKIATVRVFHLEKPSKGADVVTLAQASDNTPLLCTSLLLEPDGGVAINPAYLRCTSSVNRDFLYSGGLVEVEVAGSAATTTAYFHLLVPNRDAPVPGTDYGLSLTLLDRRGDDEAFKVFNGFSAYYAVSRLKNESVRAIANVSLLDFDDQVDFEVGLGAGILWRPKVVERDDGSMGFGVAAGYGYNLMVKSGDDPGYWFVSLGVNIPNPKSK